MEKIKKTIYPCHFITYLNVVILPLSFLPFLSFTLERFRDEWMEGTSKEYKQGVTQALNVQQENINRDANAQEFFETFKNVLLYVVEGKVEAEMKMKVVKVEKKMEIHSGWRRLREEKRREG